MSRWVSHTVSVSNFTSDFSVLEWLHSTYAMIILQFYRFFNMRCSLVFLWERRWGSKPRPHCSQSHVLPSTPLWGSRLKLLRNKCDHEFLRSILDYPHHNNISAHQHTDAAYTARTAPILHSTQRQRCVQSTLQTAGVSLVPTPTAACREGTARVYPLAGTTHVYPLSWKFIGEIFLAVTAVIKPNVSFSCVITGNICPKFGVAYVRPWEEAIVNTSRYKTGPGLRTGLIDTGLKNICPAWTTTPSVLNSTLFFYFGRYFVWSWVLIIIS